jgi:lysophospholipase L1-like esterase
MELAAQVIKINFLPPKWYKLDATNRLDPKWPAGKTIDYADTVQGRGARLGVLCVNSLGFRGRERRLKDEREPGRLRVYCLGSSTTFGWGATTDDATYPAQLELCLKPRFPNQSVEVINAGIPGNGSHDELGILKADLDKLRPDLVVIASGWPDWSHYMMPGNANPQSSSNGLVAAIKRSGSFYCAEYLRDQFIPRPTPPSEEELSHRKGLEHFRAEVLKLFKNNLSEMIRICREHQTPVIVAGMASPLRVEPEALSPLARTQAANRLHVLANATFANLRQGILNFDQAIAESCGAQGAAYVEPESLPRDPRLFFDGVHMTDEGYAALATSLSAPVATALQNGALKP